MVREITSDAGNAEPHRNRSQSVRAVEIQILAGVEHVEAADPGANRQREQPRLPPAASAHSEPAADRRDSHREAQKQLRVGGVALRQRIPEHDRQRDRRQHQAQRPEPPGRDDEHDRRDDHEDRGLRRGHRAARDLAAGGPRVQRVHARVDQPVESHRGADRAATMATQNPSDHRPA